MSETEKQREADPREPHWVVVQLSSGAGKEEPRERKNGGWRRLFRHASELAANTECARLAWAMPGKRFTVYASGKSHKIERDAPTP
jgi:hypothetical protein